MQIADFTEDRPSDFVPTTHGTNAFVPHPLPPPLSYSPSLVRQLSRADLALGELQGLARLLPNPRLLIGPFIRREAVLSSRIEGTRSSLEDLLQFEVQTQLFPDAVFEEHDDVREVSNYVRAMEFGIERLGTLPLSLRMVRELHAHLMRGVRGGNLTPGEFRRSQNFIGARGATILEALYVPPPVPEMERALHALEDFLHAPSELPALVRLALVHYQFEAIHPFADGNGRVGRLLIPLMMSQEGLIPQPILYLSAFFERNRREYMEHLLAVSQRGAWEPWIVFFLRGVAEQARDASIRSARLQQLLEKYRAAVADAVSGKPAAQLVERVMQWPMITKAVAAEVTGVSHTWASKLIDRFVALGILERTGTRQRLAVYAATEVLRILNTPVFAPEPREA